MSNKPSIQTETIEYFDALKSIKKTSPDSQIWTQKLRDNKKFLLLCGGTVDDRKVFINLLLKEINGIIPDGYQLITKKEVNCSDMNDTNLKKRVFLDVRQKVKNISSFLGLYNSVKSGSEGYAEKLITNFSTTNMENVFQKYKKHEGKYNRDIENTFCLRDDKLNKMSENQRQFLKICTGAFKSLELYDGKTKGLFFLDLLNTFEPISWCNILVLKEISSANNKVWDELRFQYSTDEPKYKPDIIFATAENKEDIDGLHEVFKGMFEIIDLSEKEPEAKQELQLEVKSTADILSYDKVTGKFKFGRVESIAISKTARANIRMIAEQLMECWQKGESCPQHKIVKDPNKKTPQGIYDNITDIRAVLNDMHVNMPQCSDEAYSPPSEPKHFGIIKKLV